MRPTEFLRRLLRYPRILYTHHRVWAGRCLRDFPGIPRDTPGTPQEAYGTRL